MKKLRRAWPYLEFVFLGFFGAAAVVLFVVLVLMGVLSFPR